jgi:hypothetical protein
MSNKRKYNHIRSYRQLREEIIGLEKEIESKELMIDVNYLQFKESISITRLLSLIITRISVLIPFINLLKTIYSMIVSLFSKKDEGVSETIDEPIDREN